MFDYVSFESKLMRCARQSWQVRRSSFVTIRNNSIQCEFACTLPLDEFDETIVDRFINILVTAFQILIRLLLRNAYPCFFLRALNRCIVHTIERRVSDTPRKAHRRWFVSVFDALHRLVDGETIVGQRKGSISHSHGRSYIRSDA